MGKKIKVNGDVVDFSNRKNTFSLYDLVLHYNLRPETIAVQRNGDVTQRKKWKNIFIENEDEIEIIHFVGGG